MTKTCSRCHKKFDDWFARMLHEEARYPSNGLPICDPMRRPRW